MRFLQPIHQSLHRLLTEPLEELTRAQRSLRYILDFGRYCAQELRADRAGEMAAALTYHTLFSLLPTIVLMLVILQTFVGEQERESLKQNVVDFALQWIQPESESDTAPTIQLDEGTGTQVSATAAGGEYTLARQNLGKNIQDLIAKLEQINFASIGVVGVLLFIYAATKLLTTIEHSFNRITDAPFSRPLYVRLPLYYTAITLAPLLLLSGQFVQNRIITVIEQAAAVTGQSAGWLGGFTALITPFVTTWLLLILMYQFLPNTKVKTRAALTGGFVAALCWTLTIEGFKVYVRNAGTANIYGALALVPLFLLWLWFTWLIVLFGIEVTYTIQAMDGRRFKSQRTAEDRDVLFDPRWMIPLVAMIGKAFEAGNPVRFNELQSETGLPNRAVASLIDLLTKANVIHHVEHGEPGVPAYTLARPPERIGVDELLDISEKTAMRERSRSKLVGTDLVAQLHTAQINAAKNTTLADVMRQHAD
jgi:membrane protein